MPSEVGQRFDFFLSRRGSVAAVAQEVSNVLTDKGYKVIVQDYDIPLGASFVEAMYEAVKNSRDLIILFTGDYEASPYSRKEFTSFEAERLRDERERHIVVLRCEDAPLRGLLADVVYQDLVGVAEPEERKRRILAAAERRSSAERPQRSRGGRSSACRRALPASPAVRTNSTGSTPFSPRRGPPPSRRSAGRRCRAWAGSERRRSPSNTPTAVYPTCPFGQIHNRPDVNSGRRCSWVVESWNSK
jgi:hypothetical protein